MKYFTIISYLALFYCTSPMTVEKPAEIISLLTLENGATDTLYLSDIFYAKKYNPDFQSNPDINVKYISDKNRIILEPKKGFSGLTFIKLNNQNQNMVVPVRVKNRSKVIFQYKPDKPQKNMYVMGNFNNWNRHGTRMTDEDGNGIYEAAVYLDEGIYEYQFVLDKQEIYDPKNPEKVDNGFGYFNSLKRVISGDRINSPKLYWIPSNQNNSLTFTVNSNSGNDDIKLYTLLDNNLIPADNIIRKKNQHYELDLDQLPDLNIIQRLRLIATKNNLPGNILSVWIKNDKVLPPNQKYLWQDAIIYSLMIDRFKDGNPNNDNPVEDPRLAEQANFQGGDFAGISQCITNGYFDSLGVNTIWISPVNKTTNKAFKEWPEPHRYYSGYHGYWPVSSIETEPRFGSMQELKDLIALAHKHNLKVLMDYISHHVHEEHPFFKNHRDWFGKVDLENGEKNIRRWDEYRLTTWFDTFLPSFDYLGSDSALQTMTDNAVWWLKETKVDGFRHDATKHVPYAFWRTLTRKIDESVNVNLPFNVYQIGETFGGDDLIKSYVNNGMLNAQFNFNQFFVARRVFVEKEGNFEDLTMAIEKSLDVYGYNNLMGNLMDSHDQVRMMALLEGDLTLSDNGTERAWHEPRITVDQQETYKKETVFLTYLLTVPGIPIIYYGDEFGMTGANDPDNRRMMRFGSQLSANEAEQLKKISQLIRLRDSHSSLRRGDYKTLFYDKNLLAYTRGDNNERLIVVLNKSTKTIECQIKLPEWLHNTQLKSLSSGQIIKISNQNNVSIKIEKCTADIFKLL